MRVLHIDYVKEGMCLARGIRSASGLVLLCKGVSLTDQYINQLRKLGVQILYVDDPRTAGIQVKDVISEELRVEATSAVVEVASQLQARPDVTEGVSFGGVAATMDDVVAELSTAKERLVQLLTFKTFDDYTFQHSVEVAILSVIIGLDLYLDKSDLAKLAIGCALHDIGKMLVPKDVLNKTSGLNLEETKLIKKHARYGFELLKRVEGLSPLSINVALSHHERFDGSGYPRGLSKARSHVFAQIAAVADVYDALTTNRPYRKAMKPHEALAKLRSWAGRVLNPSHVDILIKHVAPYQPGSFVKLNTGEIAVVVKVDKKHLDRPTLRLIRTALGKDFDEPKTLELSEHPHIKIEQALDDPDDIGVEKAA